MILSDLLIHRLGFSQLSGQSDVSSGDRHHGWAYRSVVKQSTRACKALGSILGLEARELRAVHPSKQCDGSLKGTLPSPELLPDICYLKHGREAQRLTLQTPQTEGVSDSDLYSSA